MSQQQCEQVRKCWHSVTNLVPSLLYQKHSSTNRLYATAMKSVFDVICVFPVSYKQMFSDRNYPNQEFHLSPHHLSKTWLRSPIRVFPNHWESNPKFVGCKRKISGIKVMFTFLYDSCPKHFPFLQICS